MKTLQLYSYWNDARNTYYFIIKKLQTANVINDYW